MAAMEEKQIPVTAMAEKKIPVTAIENQGGKMVVELVGTYNMLMERMKSSGVSSSSAQILFKALKLSLPILQALPLLPGGRSPLTKSHTIAFLLADLQMDAEVVAAGILREVWEAGAISMDEVAEQIGEGTAHLLKESTSLNKNSFGDNPLDNENADAIRKFALTHYDIRAVVIDLVVRLDMMTHLSDLPKFQQQTISLEAMKIHAPLAHAIGTFFISEQLEDLAFRYLFPSSFLYVETWLKSHEAEINDSLTCCKEKLLDSLKSDALLEGMIDSVSVKGRCKTRCSTMKKLIRDGRKLEDVHDIMGMRVILALKPSIDSTQARDKACYRAREVIQSLWKEVPGRTKDYIASPKSGGYKSLHMAVDVSDAENVRPMMEIQIRTTEMDKVASAAHSLYKGGLTDPEEGKRLKAIMVATAEQAAHRLQNLPSSFNTEIFQKKGLFLLLDKNGDGRVSIEELIEMMEELGAQAEDAKEMMQLLDANNDGSLTSDEFDSFQKQIGLMRNIDNKDEEYKIMLENKLPKAEEKGLIQIYRNGLSHGVATSQTV